MVSVWLSGVMARISINSMALAHDLINAKYTTAGYYLF